MRFNHSLQRSRNKAGFTLMELLIVVAIIVIIATFAIPSYFEYVRKGDRAQAGAVLQDNAHHLQAYYNVRNTYVGASLAANQSPIDGTAKYTISLDSATQTSFTLKALPIVADPECGTLTLTSTGVKSIGGSRDVAYCWK